MTKGWRITGRVGRKSGPVDEEDYDIDSLGIGSTTWIEGLADFLDDDRAEDTVILEDDDID